SSEQIVRLLKLHGEEYDPDLVILYCGNNDASISGAYPDEELLAGQKLQSLRGIFSHLALYRLMRSALIGLRSSAAEDEGELTVRVSPERFGRNLAEIAAYCRKLDCPLIILKPPTPYLWPAGLQFKPFVHMTGESGQLLLPPAMAEILGRDLAYCWDEKRFADLYGEGDVFTRQVYQAGFIDSLDPAEAVEHYLALIRDGHETLPNYNNLGVACWRLGEYDQAAKALEKARGIFSNQFDNDHNPAIKAALSPL
ncbi:MAG: tetratricopeptide repeat protein, partial [FCB group bacterium]|nr:tetratricopeptide repeat protein [FCB group bacterium]